MQDMRNEYKCLVGKPARKRPLERSRHRWEDNVRLDLTEIGWKCEWIEYIWLGIGTSGGLL
jgi:hypothetical protein